MVSYSSSSAAPQPQPEATMALSSSPTRQSLGLSIRWTLPTLIITPLITGIGLTGWLAYYNGHKAVNALANRLSVEVSQQIEQRVDTYLGEPQMVQSTVASSIQSAVLDLGNPKAVRQYFWQLTSVDHLVSTLYYGTAAGDFYGVSQEQDGSVEYWVRNADTAPMRRDYRLDQAGEPSQQIREVQYDHRQRPWYGPAIESQAPVWSPIYHSVSPPDLTITRSLPFKDAKGNVTGVLAVDIFLQEISNFLQQLPISKSGKAFIIDRSGNLVAVSAGLPYQMVGDTPQQLAATDADDPLLQATAQHLLDTYGAAQAIATDESLTFDLQDQGQQLVYLSSLDAALGLDWLIVVVIPERDFMGAINANMRSTIAMGLAITAAATLLGLLAALWIIRPIERLNRASQEIQTGQFEPESLEPTAARPDELGKLAKLFLDMALVVSSREQSLAEQVTFLRAEMQQQGGLSAAQLLHLQSLLEKSQAARAHHQDH